MAVKRTANSSSRPPTGRTVSKQAAKEQFARRLYQLMLEKGWRQAELARKAGLERNAISVYVRGASLPSPESLHSLAKALGVTATDLLPDYVETPLARDNPEIELRVSPTDSKYAFLRINKLVRTSLAVKIMSLIEAENEEISARK